MRFLQFSKERQMDRKELAYAKQAVMAIKDWDAFQAVIRGWARLMKRHLTMGNSLIYEKKGR
jgi:hypothetical protein